jgi:hypothetical protein
MEECFCTSVVGNMCCASYLQPVVHVLVYGDTSAVANSITSRCNKVTHSK